MALELLPPHLGPSKVQWMNNRLSIRFCSQGWPWSPFCKNLVRVEGCPCAILLGTNGRPCFPALLVHPLPFRASLTLLGNSHFPGLSVTNTSKPRTCRSCTLLLLPARPGGWQDEQKVTCRFSLPFPLLGYNPLLKLIPKTTERRRKTPLQKKKKGDHSSRHHSSRHLRRMGGAVHSTDVLCTFWALLQKDVLTFV